MNVNDETVLPDAVSTDADTAIDMDKCNQVGEQMCGLLNVTKLTPNEGFMTLMAVVGSVCDAASSSLIDQIEMRQRFCQGLLQIGTHLLRQRLQVAPSTPTEQ